MQKNVLVRLVIIRAVFTAAAQVFPDSHGITALHISEQRNYFQCIEGRWEGGGRGGGEVVFIFELVMVMAE